MKVQIIADSVSQQGIRITTFHLRYWRAIHSELMTHRVFSRNARSSRAVPSATLIHEPSYIPEFGMNKPGMQSELKATPELQAKWAKEWEELANACRAYVKEWSEEGMHKQWANRPLEWFGYIDVLVTSTYWNNFFELRISPYAQPEFDSLARAMSNGMVTGKPQLLQAGQWHLPYIKPEELEEHGLETCLVLSTARCARLSYRPFDGQDSLEAEIDRYKRLVVSRPVHASPAEHQATPDHYRWGSGDDYNSLVWDRPHLHGNFLGWVQHRKMLPHEAVMNEGPHPAWLPGTTSPQSQP